MNQALSRQLTLERQQGYRGPATRFVAPIASLDEANLVVRECSLALIALGGFQIFLTLRLGSGSVAMWGSVAIGVAIILAAGALRLRPGLLTAAILLLLCVSVLLAQVWMLAIGYAAPLLLPSVKVLLAARAGWGVWRGRACGREVASPR